VSRNLGPPHSTRDTFLAEPKVSLISVGVAEHFCLFLVEDTAKTPSA
jgi:hypothetical protein